MKPTFSDLTSEQQATFGNGCTLVPDFIFTASCQQHDFNYARGGGLRDKIKADWDMCSCMWNDSYFWWHYIITVTYWIGLTLMPFPYFFFSWSKEYKTLDYILYEDELYKE